MTENGDPLENAVAERVNGIIKGEYLKYFNTRNIRQAKGNLRKAVKLYNTERPHLSIGMKTPNLVHEKNLKIKRIWKNYYNKNRKVAEIKNNGK